MRVKSGFLLFILFSLTANAQVLLETPDGEELLQNPIGISNSTLIGNFNISEQSAQFKTIFILPHKGIFPNQYFTLGLKGKPTNGISTLFAGGKLNPGTNLNLSYTKVNLFSNPMSKFIDYFSVRADYNLNKFTVFNPDNDFKSQFENINFQGGGVSLNYNNLVFGKNLFTLSAGYRFMNNYLSLDQVEVRDYKILHDNESDTYREYGKIVTGRRGQYKEYHSFPLRLGYTLTPSEYEEEQEDIKFGFTLYYMTDFGDFKPAHNIGAVLFLTKQNLDTGVRIPIVGLGIQVNDMSGNIDRNKKFSERVLFNLTTAFNITGF